MSIFNQIKNFFFKNLIVIIFYYVSFHSFEAVKQLPILMIFSFNLHMIIIYFYILKFPDNLGNGHIFLGGIINDVVIGIPLGVSSLSFLVLSFFTVYIRTATIRSKMISEWTAFMPALFFSNLVYFIIINNFSHLSFYYIELIRNTFFTFLFFPIFYYLFNSFEKHIIKKNNA
jgi:cell shape-determining protein MreD|tara:strand:- start:1989 stop:2507 length:519 start_codon:yes stop_codon:yes gene_type:complete